MIRRLALLAVLAVAAACTPGSSPADGLETTPPLTSPDTTTTETTETTETEMTDTTTDGTETEPTESPAAS